MTTDAWLVVLAVLLVAVAGLLTSAETAIARVSRSQVDDARREGDGRAARLLLLLQDRPRHVNVLLFLSTVATVTATVLVGFVCVDALTDPGGSPVGALVLAVVLMVIASYVVVGVAARTLGRQHSERIAMAAAGPARFLATIIGPLASLLIL
ncbi:MAG: DUF21 domain-containing protein, partial [Actinobacteria bacterium]|nr:DUF21 domain-containing protein [Actinomycetota bacterium]